MFLRVTAELGIVGLLYFGWLIFYFWPRGGTAQEQALAMSFLCYLFLEMPPVGRLFRPEQFFFHYGVCG